MTCHVIIVFLLLIGAVSTSAEMNPTPPPPLTCSDELLSFSACLPYVGASPNNLTDAPTPQCCDDVSSSLLGGSAVCLCYLVLRPDVLGFPIDAGRVVSLTSVCPAPTDQRANFTIESLCSGVVVLPPLESLTGHRNSSPSETKNDSPPSPLMDSAQEREGGLLAPEPANELIIESSSSSAFSPVDSSTYGFINLVGFCLVLPCLHIHLCIDQ